MCACYIMNIIEFIFICISIFIFNFSIYDITNTIKLKLYTKSALTGVVV